jgi:hypothetical protein
MKKAIARACCGLLLFASAATAGHTLTRVQLDVLQRWLSAHRGFRSATIADCDCAEDIAAMRKGFGGLWKPVPDYQPYRATGDFNGDGRDDFAVVVVDASKSVQEAFTLLVFNGPFLTTSGPIPAFEKAGLDFRWTGLSFGPPRPRPYRLVIGRFESEGMLLRPTGRSYQLSDDDAH